MRLRDRWKRFCDLRNKKFAQRSNIFLIGSKGEWIYLDFMSWTKMTNSWYPSKIYPWEEFQITSTKHLLKRFTGKPL